ncbi:hypothetical protein GGR56DRAFT_655780 [Xylariaceae sp. FL0804]|nr:hypothetical protein GGR56DRAFT_655780 [Xylariaceae sp. FL0804]
MKLDINPDKVPLIKVSLHAVQAVLLLVIFILEIIVFRADNALINGDNGWPFGLCFLSIPAILYLALTPRYERTRRVAQPHAMAVIDALFALFWLSAFASQAAYDTANNCGSACKVSKAVVGLAFFEVLLWIASSIVSGYTLRYYQNNGDLPGYEKLGSFQNIDPDKAAFSMAPHDEEAYAPVHHNDHDDHLGDHNHLGGGIEEPEHRPYDPDSYGARPLYEAETSYRPQHTASPAPGEEMFTSDAYHHRPHSASPRPPHDPYAIDPYAASTSPGPHIYAPPAAEEYNPHDGPAHFPSANYDRTLH